MNNNSMITRSNCVGLRTPCARTAAGPEAELQRELEAQPGKSRLSGTAYTFDKKPSASALFRGGFDTILI